jgi:predicted acylesterase/phospholipase RssA
MGQGPLQYCDLVMKGGITSGVIYPAAAYELAQKYSFKNIGGTSAGAIAAAVVAAAELGRRRGSRASENVQQKAGFEVVKALSREVASNGKLLKLFTPDPQTAKIFQVFLNVMGRRGVIGKLLVAITGSLFATLLVSSICFCIGLALPTILFSLAKWHSFRGCGVLVSMHPVICLLSGLPLGLFLALVGSLISGTLDTIKALASNSFGMCSGMARSSRDEASLTEWIDQQIQAAAGLDTNAKSVTFGDLWHAPPYETEAPKKEETDRTINLEVVTTSLTEGRPYSVPFQDGALYFDEDELSKLFPARIIRELKESSERARQEKASLPAGQQSKRPYRSVCSPSDEKKILIRLPENTDLPILVATRMSLSFPGLLSAIPFYRVDYTLKRNQDEGAVESDSRVGTKVWFSDGGICSNFPIGFFDSPLPRWPTFGINLTSAPSTSCAKNVDRPPEKFVSMLKPAAPARIVWNDLGDAVWNPDGVIEQRHPLDCIARFAHAIMNTMQNWRDNIQAIAPGYRDRIASVQLCNDEGGLNLNMPNDLINALTSRGRVCGETLNKFDFSQHIFTRFRISVCALEDYLLTMDKNFSTPLPQDKTGWEYIKGKQTPPHYEWDSEHLRDDAARALDQIHDLLSAWQAHANTGDARFCRGVPKPTSTLQARPDF